MLIFSSPKVSHHSQHPELADRCRLPHPMCVCLCVSEHIQHVWVIFNACTSHIHHGPSWSFISLLYPPLPLMWETQESHWCCTGEWNRVDLCSPHQGRGLPLICCVFLVSFIHCPLPSIARSNSSQTSSTSATSVANSLLSSLLMRPAGNVFFFFCLFVFVFCWFFFLVFFCQASNLQVIWGPECSQLI